jgi:zona occludens toxin
MIVVVEGPPGSGKSYSCVTRIYNALNRGQYVATNIQLSEGWALEFAKASRLRRLIPGRVEKLAAKYEANLFMSGDLEELMRVRLQGKGEERGLLLLDEAHNWMNSRTWTAGDRERLVRFFTQHRKLGWNVFLVSQRSAAIDAQVRGLCEYRITLRNLRRVRLAGIPVVPFNLFLALWSWESVSNELVQRDFYRLNKRIARQYDSLALSHGLEEEGFEAIWLPPLAEVPEAPSSVTAEVPNQPAA